MVVRKRTPVENERHERRCRRRRGVWDLETTALIEKVTRADFLDKLGLAASNAVRCLHRCSRQSSAVASRLEEATSVGSSSSR